MFTGIVQGKGVIRRATISGGELKLVVDIGSIGSYGIRVGDSVAVDGACLTVVDRTGDDCRFHLSRETLERTLLGAKVEGDLVNLELALLPSTRIGGHFVTGHVDGIGTLERLRQDGESWGMSFRAPSELSRFIARKGSICIDGVSLTVNSAEGDSFDVNVIPHTLQATTMQGYTEGRQVHLEIDLVARYLDRLIEASEVRRGSPTNTTGGDAGPLHTSEEEGTEGEIDEDFLKRQGFLAPDMGE